MQYDYACTKCKNVQEESCSVQVYKTYHPKCNKCGSKCDYQFNPSGIQFVLKDGPSGSWPSKGNRIKGQMNKKNDLMIRRQRDRYGGGPTAVPNFGGKEVESWEEAKNIALKEKGPHSAATYDQIIKKTKKSK
jgi:hypothetical protein